MLRDFKEFMSRGNVIDLAVAVVIGAAFGRIVTSLVDGVLMPPIGLALGKVDFANLFIDLSGQHPVSVAEAKAKGLPIMAVGAFLNEVISFLIIAIVVFLLVKTLNRLKNQAPPPANTKDCAYCLSAIPLAATRCSACCSDVAAA
jgi:large conductance mechanosensitive channel